MRSYLIGIGKNKFIKGGAILTLANISVSFFNYLFNSLAGKALGPGGFGEITATFAYFNILSIPLLVITTVIIRRLGYAGEKRVLVGKTFEVWFWKKSTSILLFLPLSYACVLILPTFTNLSELSIITLITLIIINFFAIIYLALLQGLHFFAAFSIITVLAAALKLVGSIGAFIEMGDISLIYFFVIISSALPVIVGKWRFRSIKISKKSSYTFDKRIRHIVSNRSILYTGISLLSITALSNIDIIFAKKILDSSDAGIYSAWSLCAKIILYFIGPVNAISLIFFSAKENQTHARNTMKKIVGMFILLGIIMFIGYSFAGRILVEIIFSPSYYSVVPLLGKAALFGIMYTLITVINNYYLARNSNKSLLVSIIVPFYIAGLILFGRTIDTFIYVNIFIAAATLGIYAITLANRTR